MRYFALQFSHDVEELEAVACASDAAFADNIPTHKSTEGYIFNLFRGAVEWGSRKQATVTTSSTEAELLALKNATKYLYEWSRLFKGVYFDPGHPVSIGCDNQQTICLLIADTPCMTTCLPHINISQHWLRQEVQENH
jgi:hypothetical protein